MNKIHNHFEFYRIKDGQQEHIGHAENVVLNKFYDNFWSMFTNSRYYPGVQAIALGTGTTTPSAADSGLTTYYAGYRATRTYIGYNSTYGYNEYQYTITLLPTDAVGVNFSEVGLSMASYNYVDYVVTKALITDNSGNPISILKASDESLIITATLYIYDMVYTTPLIKPAREWMPKWVEQEWAGYYHDSHWYIDWASGAHRFISGAYDAGDGDYDNWYYYFLPTPPYFKGIPQIGVGNDYRSGTLRPYGEGFYKSVVGNLNAAPTAATLNTTEGNVSGAPTCDIYQVDVEDHIGSATNILACYPMVDVPITNVTLGTGDGVKDTFYIPHEAPSNISCSETGYDIVEKQVSEVVPLYTASQIMTMFNKNRKDYYSASNMTKGDWIPYKSGYFHVQYWSASQTYLYGTYVYYDSTAQQYMCVPERISAPGLVMESRGCCAWLAPDQSCLLIIMNNGSVQPTHYLKTYIVDYDKVTGTLGNIIYTSTYRPMFTQDMTRIVEVHGSTLYVYTFTRTSSAITTTQEFTASLSGTSGTSRLVPLGTSYIVNGQIRVAGSSCNTYNIDFTNKTVTLLQYSGYNSGVCTNNYTATYSSNILTIFNVVGGVATQVFTKDYTGTKVVTSAVGLRSLIEYNNRLYVLFWKYNTYDNAVALTILDKDTDGNWYVVNDQTSYYTTPSDGEDASGAGLIHSEFTINNMYTIVDNAMDFASGIAHPGSNVYEQYRCSYEVPCIRRKKKVGLKFATPPASGTAIVVGYHLDYFPKDTNWILNVTPTATFSRPS